MGKQRSSTTGKERPRLKPAASSWTWAVPAALLLVYGLLFHAIELPSISSRLDAESTFRRWEVYTLLADWPFLIARWFGEPGEAGMLERLPILLASGAILLVALAAGWLALRWLDLESRFTYCEQVALAGAIGLQAVSLFMLLIGLAGGIGTPWPLIAAGAFVLIAARWHFRARRPARPKVSPNAAGDASLSPRWLWLAAPIGLVMLLAAMLPPTGFDVREYHLQAPKEFFQNGRIGFLPHNVYANMPLGAEMHALAGMTLLGDWFRGALVGKTVMALHTALAALLVYCAALRWYGRTAAIAASVLYVTVPWITLVSVTGLNEGACALFWFASLFVVMRMEEGTMQWQMALLAGWLAGAAAACKYPGALFVIVPLFAWLVLRAAWRSGSLALPTRRSLLPAAAFALAATVAFGPWLLKNAWLTGNPFYPLLDSIFSGATRTPELVAQWNAVHRPPGYSLPQLFASTVDLLVGNEWASPWLIVLALLPYRGRLASPVTRRLLYYTAFVLAAWWLATHRLDRFWTPLLPVPALLAGDGCARMHRVFSNRFTWMRWLTPLLLAWCLLYAMVLATSGGLGAYQRYFVRLELLEKDPARVDPVHLWANDPRNEVERLLLVGDAQPFDLRVPVIYNTVFDPSQLLAMHPEQPERFRQDLVARGISHLYVHWGEIDRYRSPGNYGFPEEITPELFARLVAAGVLEPLVAPDASGRYHLYRVR